MLLSSLPSLTGHYLQHPPLAPCLRHGTHHPRPHALKAQKAWHMCRRRNNKRKSTWDGHAPCSYARDDDDPPDAVADESMSPEGGDDDSDTKELTSPGAAVLDDKASDTRGLSMEPRGFPEVGTCRACPCRAGGASTQHAGLPHAPACKPLPEAPAGRHRRDQAWHLHSLQAWRLHHLRSLKAWCLHQHLSNARLGRLSWLPCLVAGPVKQLSAGGPCRMRVR